MTIGCLLGATGIAVTDVVLSPQAGVGTIGIPMAVAGIGFGMAIVPVTSTALTAVPAERSGMAAGVTNASRELGAVSGVAVLGAIVYGQLTVDLVRRLAAIGIPRQFRSQVVTAVTTGTFDQQAGQAAAAHPGLAAIIHRVTEAAYGSFAHGLDISLSLATALLGLSALVAWLGLRRHPMVLDRAEQRVAARAGRS
jgi:hypothetical protein